MPLDPSIMESIREAAGAHFEPPTDGEQATAQDPAVTEGAAPEAPAGEAATEVAPETESAPPAEGQQATAGEEAPTEYFGVDLSDLEPEVRVGIITRMKEQDKFVQRILQRNAELERKATETPAAPAVEEQQPQAPPSDEDILSALGYDKEDPMFEVKSEVALPLAKQVLQLRDMVQGLAYNQQVEQELARWQSGLDKMEQDFGPLPKDITREDVVDFAIENGIFDPVDAYHRITAPLRRAVSAEATKARQEALAALRKEHASPARPRTSTATEQKALEATNTRDAVKEAAELAAAEAGYSWADALAAFGQ